jgi:tetratricopeptide (TPR) repeat protein
LAHRRTTSLLAAAAALAACGGVADGVQRGGGPGEPVPVFAALAAPEGPGSAQLRTGDLAGARATFEAALAADPDRLAELNDLAVSYHLEGRDEAARQLLDEVVARGRSQEQLAALVNLAGLYALQGYLPVALAHVEAARSVDLSRPEPLYAAALLADARADAAAAVALARQALRADEGGRRRQELAFASPEERLHLEALLAEATGDRAGAAERWRELRGGRFAALAAAAERHLGGR